jgi:hypothetical protein
MATNVEWVTAEDRAPEMGDVATALNSRIAADYGYVRCQSTPPALRQLLFTHWSLGAKDCVLDFERT